MKLSRRGLAKLTAGTGAYAAFIHTNGSAALARTNPDFRAVVSITLSGGSDGWSMIVPTDDRYDSYQRGRGRTLAIPRDALIALQGEHFGLHPALASLKPIWENGNLSVVLNTGALIAPLTKPTFRRRPDLRPAGAMMHTEGEAYWRGNVAIDRWTEPTSATRDSLFGDLTENTEHQQKTSNAPITARIADKYFGADAPLQSSLKVQMRRAALKIADLHAQGRQRAAFNVPQLGYDTHADQADLNDPTQGTLANLFRELGEALSAFQGMMTELGLAENVTTFTRSEFGRAFRLNDEAGTDHGWGNNHIVIGGAVRPRCIHGRYPDMILDGAEDSTGAGCWIPSTSIEEYLAPIAEWYGVPEKNMAQVFPNLPRWTSGRASKRLFA